MIAPITTTAAITRVSRSRAFGSEGAVAVWDRVNLRMPRAGIRLFSGSSGGPRSIRAHRQRDADHEDRHAPDDRATTGARAARPRRSAAPSGCRTACAPPPPRSSSGCIRRPTEAVREAGDRARRCWRRRSAGDRHEGDPLDGVGRAQEHADQRPQPDHRDREQDERPKPASASRGLERMPQPTISRRRP